MGLRGRLAWNTRSAREDDDMTTTEIELHVFITAEDDHRRIAVVDGTRPYIRPAVDDLWGDQHRVRRPAPLAGRIYVSPDATGQEIAAEVAYLALTAWPAPSAFPWDRLVFARSQSVGGSPGGSVAKALADLHAVMERHVFEGGLSTVRAVNTKIDLEAAVDSAMRRSEAELRLEAAACLADEEAVAWLDGDRTALARLLPLARAAGVRSFGVYAGETEILDTIILRPPPVENPVPSMDVTERRWRASRGEPVFLSRDELVIVDDRERRGPGGVSMSTMLSAVRRGFAKWTDGMQSALRPTAVGLAAREAGRLPDDIASMFAMLDHRGLVARPKTHEPRHLLFVEEERIGECTVFRSCSRGREYGPSATHTADMAPPTRDASEDLPASYLSVPDGYAILRCNRHHGYVVRGPSGHVLDECGSLMFTSSWMKAYELVIEHASSTT